MKHPYCWRSIPRLIVCAGLILGASAAVQQSQQPTLLLEEATKKELIDGDLKSAIEICQNILGFKTAPRDVTAKALLHLGQCYEKLGSREARKAYERLVREFADQPDEVELARARLATLGGPDRAMRVRQVWAGPDEDLIGAPTRDGRYLTLQDWPSQDLAVRDLTTGRKRRLTHKDPRSLEFASVSVPSPDGKEVAYAWYNKDGFSDLRIIGLDGSNPRVLYANPELAEVAPSGWSPDGSNILAIFYMKDKGSQIALVSVVDGSVRILKRFGQGVPNGACFSPDGTKIAYDFPQQAGSRESDICVLAVASGQETVVVRNPANDVVFDWTPDGKRILFGSDRS